VSTLSSKTIVTGARPALALPATARAVLSVLAMTALLGVAANVRLQLPFTPVPVTFQTLIVLCGGALLGWRRGLLAVALTLGLGGLGVPLFAGGVASIGYLAGFALAAALTGGLLAGRRASLARTLVVMIAGEAAILATGLAWLCALGLPFATALTVGVLPFLLWDGAKIAVAASTYRLLHR
jgi:biotin transport system substrate-specific component